MSEIEIISFAQILSSDADILTNIYEFRILPETIFTCRDLCYQREQYSAVVKQLNTFTNVLLS